MSSPIIAFVSFFLSLTLGTQPVAVLVNDDVDRVELWLNSQPAAVLTGPPWRAEIDFGDDLAPHHLEAVALDAEGDELSRVDQWVNLPTPTADANIVIERRDDGSAFARLTWANLMGDEPETIAVSMDGQALEVVDPAHIPLPPHDLEQLHFLRAELSFAYNVSVLEEVTFGGSYGDQLSTDLTALPVVVEGSGKRGRLPDLDALQDWFVSGGERATVAAVADEGPAEITIIRDRPVQAALERLVAGNSNRLSTGAGLRRSFFSARFDAALKPGQKLAFFWPFLVQSPSGPWTFPPLVGWMFPQDGGVGWFLANGPPPPPPDGRQLLADAVAVAGMNSLARNRRRAVVLILGERPEDDSRLTPEIVKRYLASIRVPLFVWSPYKGIVDSPWGEVRDVSTFGKLRSAVSDLSREVARQRIVWLQGRHLPQRIQLSEAAGGIDFPG